MMLPRDYVEEMALIMTSQMQRRAWEFALLLGANLKTEEAEQIADLAAADRAEMSQPQGIAA